MPPPPRRETARSALAVGGEALAERSSPAYASRYSPRKSIQRQHLAVLAVRRFFDLDYRSTEELLRGWSDPREAIGLKSVPDRSTLEKAAKRLLKKGASTGSPSVSVAPRESAA